MLEAGGSVGGVGSGVVGVIEHNFDVIRCGDWVIDLGPEGGDKGGEIVVAGTPEELQMNSALVVLVQAIIRQELIAALLDSVYGSWVLIQSMHLRPHQ